MRAPFNTLAEIWSGPGAIVPGVLKGVFPARYVIEDGIQFVGVDSPVRPAYLTLNAMAPVGAWVPPEVSMDHTLADRVAIPPGTPVQWFVLFTESVLWGGQLLYYRANLVNLLGPSGNAILMESGTEYVLTEGGDFILTEV